jgi:2-C-methyl-D-erythritol 4-phosphate cytidylyltransferase
MNYAILLSGGTGSRLGMDIPKQYYEVQGKPLLSYALETLVQCEDLDGVVIVAAKEWQSRITEMVQRMPFYFCGFALPGENRQLSIYHGLQQLQQIAAAEDIVLIQDAVRPNTSPAQIEACIGQAAAHDGALPVLPMKDTVYLSRDGGHVSALLQREEIFDGQAPEAFRYGKYREANERLLPEAILHINGSAEPAILAGMDIALIPGDEYNYKITTMADLHRFEHQMENGRI